MKIEGKNAVFECLDSGKTIEKIMVQNGVDAKEIISRAKELGIKLQFVNKSVLDDIPGIGPARRKALMKKFQSMENIRNASVEELMQAEGMNQTVAETVYLFFRH